MVNVVITELDLESGNHKRFICFDLDDGKSFCYRSRTSFGAFFHSPKNRNKSSKYLYSAHFKDEHDQSIIRLEKQLPNFFQDISTTEVKNIWEFYKLIGYNYKNQKWLI